MKSIETTAGRVIVAKLVAGDDVIGSLVSLVKQYNINAGLVNIIGAMDKFTIAYFDINKNDYNYKTFEEEVELLTCMGNIAYKDGEPMVHLHVTVGRKDYSVIGGHLSQPSIISIVGEVYIYEIGHKLTRSVDNQFGLSLLDI